MHDIVIIGGGPAGLSAAINARARGKSVLVVTNDYHDSPLYRAKKVDNYLGMPGETGAQLMDTYWAHAQSMGTEFRDGRVLTVMPMEESFYLSIGTDVEEGGAIVLATGVSQGRKYPGEEEFLGQGVSYCATCDGMLYRGKNVVVVGMAPDSPKEANFLQSIGCNVTYVSAKQSEELQADIPFLRLAAFEIQGEGHVTAFHIGDATLPADCVFILRNAIPPASLMAGLEQDNGYIKVDREMKTNLPGVFAAGDCTGLPLQLSKATGEGLVAGQKAAEYIDNKSKDKTSTVQ